jgi:hypothetical protein
MTRQKMQTSKQPDAMEDEVGYKRPPVKSQFRRGQSGNPQGRPKGQRNLGPVLAEVLRQTVTVKQGGKSECMSKGEAVIRVFLTKSNNGDSRAIKAVLELSERIGRIQSTELKLGGLGNYEFMLIPGMAASAEEWQKEISARHETAALRDEIAAVRARTGALPTGDQINALRKSIAAAHAGGTSPPHTRRPVNRINKSSLKSDPVLEQFKAAAAALPQCVSAGQIPPRPPRSPTGTYRAVNRRPPPSPKTLPDA